MTDNPSAEFRIKMQRLIEKKLRNLQKREEKLQAHLDKCERWEEAHLEAQLLQAHFHQLQRGATEISVDDWQAGKRRILPLDPRLTPKEQVDHRFKRARKLRRGIAPTREQLARYAEERTQLESTLSSALEEEEVATLENLLQRWRQTPATSEPVRKPPHRKSYRRFVSSNGTEIFVGKGARDNDILTWQIARGNDTWLHVADYSGSHVIVRTANPDPQTLQDALLLALHYSRASGGSAEVRVTQRKYLRRPKKGKPGQVLLSQAKSVHVTSDEDRLRAIRERKRSE